MFLQISLLYIKFRIEFTIVNNTFELNEVYNTRNFLVIDNTYRARIIVISYYHVQFYSYRIQIHRFKSTGLVKILFVIFTI